MQAAVAAGQFITLLRALGVALRYGLVDVEVSSWQQRFGCDQNDLTGRYYPATHYRYT